MKNNIYVEQPQTIWQSLTPHQSKARRGAGVKDLPRTKFYYYYPIYMQATPEHINIHNEQHPLILVRGLEKTYYNDSVATPALRDVSFTINGGEFVAIMGPSGSGKSTLLHILGFLDEHTTGEYRFDGKTMNDYSKEEIAHVRNKKMGFVFQAFNLLPRTTVLENVT